jgi:hypothetical protein
VNGPCRAMGREKFGKYLKTPIPEGWGACGYFLARVLSVPEKRCSWGVEILCVTFPPEHFACFRLVSDYFLQNPRGNFIGYHLATLRFFCFRVFPEDKLRGCVGHFRTGPAHKQCYPLYVILLHLSIGGFSLNHGAKNFLRKAPG